MLLHVVCVSGRPVGYRKSRLTPVFLMLWVRRIHIQLGKGDEEEQGNREWQLGKEGLETDVLPICVNTYFQEIKRDFFF